MTNFITIIFSAQQFINDILINTINKPSGISFVAAFMGGLFTSISPCVLSSIPIATLYINQRQNKILSTAALCSGLITSLLSIGLISIFIKQYAWSILGKIPLLWPLLITLIGLNLLEIMPIGIFETDNSQWHHTQKSQRGLITTYLFGIALGVTISPCSTPITITLISWISITQKYVIGIYLLMIYIIGYITPLLISIISFNNFSIISKISKKSYIIVNILGFSSISIGSYSLLKEVLLLL
uniref:Thiol:disulfi de interchange protein n=1 Tax=Titanophycus setchellii TaxID=940129 RepID=A0A1G4NXS7_9FLOR|nr:Thiol:disulfi de interchange protein [Titanophycus setchellii]SCW23501.1 Thiol:disulfi de interchange protein [Titanophycus setchellii]